MKTKKWILILWKTFYVLPFLSFSQNIEEYTKVINEKGKEPIEFVLNTIEKYDLIIFDDALHPAVEPFEFYQELLSAKENKIMYVFIEVFQINIQHYIDAYFESNTKDKNLLKKVFQDDFSGYGLRYETYLNLLSRIWDINHLRNDSKKIKVIAVDQPIYWESIHTRRDYDTFLESLIGRDYFMYKTILKKMSSFEKRKKGIFLTNTRHAYKHIKNSNGELYWNCGTFFNKWHNEKTYSIRIHNATLSIENKTDTQNKNISAQGLEKYTYSWSKMENGYWDEAFKLNKNKPVAFSLKDNVFGKAKYIGNHMTNVEKNQTMYDAYDALIFLAPLDNLHFSAKMNFLYTNEFKKELKRRIKILNEDGIDSFLKKNQMHSIDKFIEQLDHYEPKSKNTFVVN